MNKRKFVACIFILVSSILGVIFYGQMTWPDSVFGYFSTSYFGQLGPLAICIELFIAGIYLFRAHPKANFVLAVFGFTALLDPLFNLAGLFTSLVPLYGTVIFVICALIALWIAFSNAFNSGKISMIGAFMSFLTGSLIELLFNYWF